MIQTIRTCGKDSWWLRSLAIVLALTLLEACSRAGSPTQNVGELSSLAPTENVTIPPHTPQVPTSIPNKTNTPTLTSTPEPSPSPVPKVTPVPTIEQTATSVPEMVLDVGEVRYEFVDPATNEAITVALPQEWVEIIRKAETKAGQLYKEVPLAQARTEGEKGSRKLMVGNIVVAMEGENGWERNINVYEIPNYIGFEGMALAQDFDLGSIDMNRISNETIILGQSSIYAEGVGTITQTLVDNVTPISAIRTNIIVPND